MVDAYINKVKVKTAAAAWKCLYNVWRVKNTRHGVVVSVASENTCHGVVVSVAGENTCHGASTTHYCNEYFVPA